MENLPSNPVAGAVLPVSSSTRGWQRALTWATASARTPCSSCKASMASMAGWVTTPQG